jgi:hypothetical protein
MKSWIIYEDPDDVRVKELEARVEELEKLQNYGRSDYTIEHHKELKELRARVRESKAENVRLRLARDRWKLRAESSEARVKELQHTHDVLSTHNLDLYKWKSRAESSEARVKELEGRNEALMDERRKNWDQIDTQQQTVDEQGIRVEKQTDRLNELESKIVKQAKDLEFYQKDHILASHHIERITRERDEALELVRR